LHSDDVFEMSLGRIPSFLKASLIYSVSLVEELMGLLREFENKVLRIFGPKTDEVTGRTKKLHIELNDLYPSLDIISVIKSRTMRWTEHVARTKHEKYVQNFSRNNLKVRDHLRALDVDDTITLTCN
jgi:hypothetical protein